MPRRKSTTQPIRDWIGTRIREIRETMGLTQLAASSRAGLDQSTWSKYERGEREPPLSQLQRIATGLGVPMERLVESPT